MVVKGDEKKSSESETKKRQLLLQPQKLLFLEATFEGTALLESQVALFASAITDALNFTYS